MLLMNVNTDIAQNAMRFYSDLSICALLYAAQKKNELKAQNL